MSTTLSSCLGAEATTESCRMPIGTRNQKFSCTPEATVQALLGGLKQKVNLKTLEVVISFNPSLPYYWLFTLL